MRNIKNIFGTDGIRTTMGHYPLTSEHLPCVGAAIAQWAQKKYGTKPLVLLAHDTRVSCAFVKASLKNGLLHYPLTIHDAGVLPTPAVFNLIQKDKAYSFGIIISASHNPYQDNGIKIIDAKNGKITEDDEYEISGLIQKKIPQQNYESLGSDIPYLDAQKKYLHAVSELFPHRFLSGKKVVLDCAHGAMSAIAPTLFKKCGAHVIALNNRPNGKNINKNCGALSPHALQEKVIETKADVGFAFDGDGDRVIAINRHGELRNGDDILSLLLMHPLYQKLPSVVGTIMTNQGFDVYLQKQNKKLVRVPVGDKYVAEYLEKENLLLGGEQSGHIIMRDYMNTGDGIVVALRLLETMILHNKFDMETFIKYPQILLNVPVVHKRDLSTPALAEIIQLSKTLLSTGRLIVRYSGTENLLRIMVEDIDAIIAQKIVHDLSQKLQRALALE